MALPDRLEMLFKDKADVWRPNAPPDAATGLPRAEEYIQIGWAVPCYFEMNPNTNDATLAGRIQRKIIFTQDIIHVSLDQDLLADYILKNVSTSADGSRGSNYGRFWRVLGDPREFLERPEMENGHKEAQMSMELVPPAGVS